jgi:hypothetical protein
MLFTLVRPNSRPVLTLEPTHPSLATYTLSPNHAIMLKDIIWKKSFGSGPASASNPKLQIVDDKEHSLCFGLG